MVLKNIASKIVPISRGISTTASNSGYAHSYRGVVGSNLPFQTENRYRLLFHAIWFVGSGIGLPFLMLRQMILAKNT